MPFGQSGRRTSRWGSSSLSNQDERYSIGNIENQISNARTRIVDSGYESDPDKRNWFEKWTNLPQGQNGFFDALELISRPGQAVMNIFDKGVTGDRGIAEAAWRGFSGKDRVRGTDLIDRRGGGENMNPYAKTILGLTTEVLTDPINLVPGAAFAKGAQGLGKAVKGTASVTYKGLERIPGFRSLSQNKIRPLAESAKDGLGYMFKRDYKIDETLHGGKSDALSRAANETENTRRFMQEESLKGITNAAKAAGGVETGVDVGRIMEAPLKQYNKDGSLFARPERELSTDPKIQSAAKDLIRSNQLLRDYARSNGVNISELEGYMSHIWSKAERTLRSNGKISNIDQGRFGAGNPNKKIISERKYKGSVEDINETAARHIFEPNSYFSTAVGQRRLIDYIQAVKFRKDVLNNTDFAVKYQPGMVIPKNAEIINSHNYTFLKDADDLLDGVVKTEKVGGKYVVTKAAKNALDRFNKINTDAGTKAFLRTFDNVQSAWKKMALFSVGYHARNLAGAMFNNYVGGMHLYNGDLIKYTTQGMDEVLKSLRGKESNLFKEYRQQGLGSSAQSNVEFSMIKSPEDTVEKLVKEGSRNTAGKIKTRLNPLRAFETSREAGAVIDQANRFAMYKFAREKLKLNPEQAAAKVKESQFDYTNLSPFEQNFMARTMPFYRWMRNNIPYQIKKSIENPKKYSNLNKLRLNAQDSFGMDEETTPEFMKEQFAVPVSKDKFLSLALPLSDLTRVTNPLKLGMGSLSPLLKTPVELAMNRNSFFNTPIEKFEGQEKQFRVPGTGVEFNIPIKTAYTAEALTGQLGRGLSSVLQKPSDVDQDKKFRLPTLGISSLLKDYDAKSALFYEKVEELNELQDYLKYIEQQTGMKPRTMNEIKKGR